MRKEEERRKSGVSDTESRKEFLEILTKRKLDDCRKGGTIWQTKRGELRNSLKVYKNVCSKVIKHCAHIRASLKREKSDRVKWLEENSELPDNLSEFKECKVFNHIINMVK